MEESRGVENLTHLIVVARECLGPFCRCYVGRTPHVTHTAPSGLNIRKLNAQGTHFVAESGGTEIDGNLLRDLRAIYRDGVPSGRQSTQTINRVYFLGFLPSDYPFTPGWTQPNTPDFFQERSGLQIQNPSPHLVNALGKLFPRAERGRTLAQANQRRRNRVLSVTNLYDGGTFSVLTLVSPQTVDLSVDRSNSNNNNNTSSTADEAQFIGRSFRRLFSLPDVIDLVGDRQLVRNGRQRARRAQQEERSRPKREREKQQDTNRKEKKRTMLSRLKLAEKPKKEEEEDKEKQPVNCVICFERFADPEKEDEGNGVVYEDDTTVIPIVLVPCQHRVCLACMKRMRSDSEGKQEGFCCPVCKRGVENTEAYHCVKCLENDRAPRGPNIVVARPCEHRVWCNECAKETIKDNDDPRCPMCDFQVDDIRVAKARE